MRYLLILVCVLNVLSVVRAEGPAQIVARMNRIRSADLPHTDTEFQPTPYASLEQWQARRAYLVEKVRFAAGLIPEPERTPLNARVFGLIDHPDYTVEKVFFESRPGFLVTGNLYRPKGFAGKRPAIACPHGHWKEGRFAHEERGSVPARCIMLARLGAVVFSYDMIGYNDSGRQLEHKDERLLTPANELWGIGPMALQTWNSIRALDFLQGLPDVDPEKIGVTGASGGGTQTFILSAVNERVKVAAPVCMISSLMQGGCPCENAPALRIGTNNMEIGALFAPRPLLMVSASGDWTKKTPEVEYPFMRSIYTLYGAADHVANRHFDAPHNYNQNSRQAMYAWMTRWLLGWKKGMALQETDIVVDKAEDLKVFADGQKPENMLPFEQVLANIKSAENRRIDTLLDQGPTGVAALREIVHTGLKHDVGSEFPEPGEISQAAREEAQSAGATGEECVLVREGRPVRLLTLQPKTTPTGRVICVHPAGVRAEQELADWTRTLLAAGREVIFVEPFGTGANLADSKAEPARGKTKFFSTFNRVDVAETVFDLLTVLGEQVGVEKGPADTVLVGWARLGPATLAARAMVPDAVVDKVGLRTVIDLNDLTETADDGYLKDLALPNIRKIGGAPALSAAAAHGGLWLHHVGRGFPSDKIKRAGDPDGVRIQSEIASETDLLQWINAGR